MGNFRFGGPGARRRLEKTRDFSLVLDLNERVRPDREFMAEVARLCGAEAIQALAR